MRRAGIHAALLLLGTALLGPAPVLGQPTVGLFVNDAPQEGLTLFGPNGAMTTYLINNDGLVVNSWTSAFRPSMMGYLLENGDLLRSARLATVDPNFAAGAGRSGRLEQYDWEGNLVWEFEYTTATHITHHDIEPLPNGNVLLSAWDYMTAAAAIDSGKDPTLVSGGLWIDHIIEVQPTLPAGGTIVWEWHARDHLIQDFDPTKANFGDVAEHPELIDFNAGGSGTDFTHVDSLDFHAGFDQILISARALDEIWVIDHTTTTAEAAGHSGGVHGRGGDLLYRWGNPQVYRRGTPADQQLFGQHDAQWIPAGYPGAGNMIVFSNGNERPGGEYSSVEEIEPPVDQNGNYTLVSGLAYGPAGPSWTWTADPPTSFFARNLSGAERQPNGNTLICRGPMGRFLEVGPDGVRTWEYLNPHAAAGPVNQGIVPSNNAVFKVRRYPFDFPGFAGRDLTPGDPVEGFTRPFPVPDGSVTAARGALDGTTIDVEWDAFSCPSVDYNLIYGELPGVSALHLGGAECAMGVSGGHLWSGVPPGDLFFMVVGTDETAVYESSWGTSAGGAERHSTKASFLCDSTTKIVTSTCP